MTDYRQRLKNLLRELFQFDTADLDFGIYRIMNQRRAEIEEFIEHGLLDIVGQELSVIQADVLAQNQAELEKQRGEVIHALGEAAFDPSGEIAVAYQQLPLALRFIQKQEEVRRTVVSAEVEAEIFNALYTFFGRYYDEGDFVTQRRYSRQPKYAVPYNGEEVLLHWANRDQYYVKTADVLTDYAFRIDSHGGYRVAFKLAAADTEQNNVKGQKRYFFPAPDRMAEFNAERRELSLFFVYRPLTEAEEVEFGKTNVQTKIIAARRDSLLAAVPDVTLRGLLASIPAGKAVCLLEMHMTRWTRKSTSDYFIHKDLKGFLEQELDFYLKNEVMRLDDVDSAQEAQVQDYLTRLKVIRRIARKIIAFLVQIEDFQKRLFEKPKFIFRSDWCVTLDRLPEALYTQINANPRQWEQWEALGMPVPPAVERNEAFLQTHPSLMVDTALYDAGFKDAVLVALSGREGGLAAQRDGLLIHGENYQALRLLQSAYDGKIKCIYIDPPYNTGGDGFVYKDTYQHSTWLTMMDDRLRCGQILLADGGAIFVQIGDEESHNLKFLLRSVFGESNFRNAIIVRRGIKNVQSQFADINALSVGHDTLFLFSKTTNFRFQKLYETLAEGEPGKWDTFWRGTDRRTMRFEIFGIKPETGQWRWSEDRTRRAINNFETYLAEYSGKYSLDEYYLKMLTEGDEQDFVRLNEDGVVQYYVPPRNYKLLSDVWMDIRTRGDITDFPTEKHTEIVETVSQWATSGEEITLDFFAGSGTTGHAVININRQDNGQRRYILVEQGGYFDTVLKPRLQKVVFAAEWKDSKPVAASPGVSHAFEYLALESYEDTLDNLDLDRAAVPPPGLFPPERDDYLLRYFLDHETRQARLTLPIFDHPYDAAIRVRRDGVEQRLPLDLVETANFMLGLTVSEQRAFTHQDRTYRLVQGHIGRHSVAVLWRDTPGLDLVAEAAYIQAEIFPHQRPDRLYVNGDSHIPDAQTIQQVFVQAMLETPQGIEEA